MEAEILEPLELQFADLIALSSPPAATSSSLPKLEEIERLESVSDAVMQALGPSGPGLLSITGVPSAAKLRRTLLPLARKLALLSNKDRARVLKEHGLGSDVPLKNLDRSVSSFASQLRYVKDQGSELPAGHFTDSVEENEGQNTIIHDLQGFQDHEFKLLGDTFKKLGLCMIELGLRVAQICDQSIGGSELKQSLMDAVTAKGRLIHYHSTLDNHILKEINQKTKVSMKKTQPVVPSLVSHRSTESEKSFVSSGSRKLGEQTTLEHLREAEKPNEVGHNRTFTDLWQQWHYDYGVFTVLTAPLFMSSAEEDYFCVSSIQESSPPHKHTYLQLFDTNKKKILVVKSPPESFIIQVGEAADILSRGKLRSTLHSVGRLTELQNLSRETFVIFLQPAWDKTLCYAGNLSDANIESHDKLDKSNGASQFCIKSDAAYSSAMNDSPQKSHYLMQEIFRSIPPLSSRLRDGMTFAEFSRETTKQYYGGSGTQSNRGGSSAQHL